MSHLKNNFSRSHALTLYRQLLTPRQIEERMLTLLRQNKISKWFSGIGQEAIAVGATRALSDNDYILPLHRNLGVFTTREAPFYPLFCQLFAKKDGFTHGRERTFHFGSLEHNIVGMISHLAATMPIADGLALASHLKQEQRIALSFCGDGGSSEGDFHEALNLAGVWKLPVIFLIENNGYGLSTPTDEQFACNHLVDRATGYGIEGMRMDGNDVFKVIEAVQSARKKALEGQPVLIEAETFRMRGHEEASGTFYVPDKLFEKWKKKDPILRMEQWLKQQDYIESDDKLEQIKKEIGQAFEPELQKALKADDPECDPVFEEQSVWTSNTGTDKISVSHSSSEKRFIDGVQLALKQAFDEDEHYIMLGQDIAEYGGVFKVTEGFVDRYGKDRIRNTPIIESGALGAALGLALGGFKPVVEMQFADFITNGMNQIINNISKGRYRWMPPLNITIRAPHGAGVGAGPFHSESPEGWFMPHPGLKIVVPSSVEDAQNLLFSALHDPNPVLFFEHKKLYRGIRATTADQCKIEALGKAKINREGKDLSIITYGMGVHWASEAAEEWKKRGVEIEILDLRCLSPIDMESIRKTVQKTNKVLLLQEPSLTLGPMSEISSLIMEQCFENLDAPVMRCASLNTPVPTAKNLEEGYLANSRLHNKIQELLNY